MRPMRMLAGSAIAIAMAACADAPTAISARDAEPALSTSTLSVTGLSCFDVGGGGVYYNNTQCSGTTSGGVGGNTYNWDVIVNYQEDYENGSYIEGVCTDSYPVTFTVTDAAGNTASLFQEFACYASSTGGGGLEP